MRHLLPLSLLLVLTSSAQAQDLYIEDPDFRLMLKNASNPYGCMDTATGLLDLAYWNQLNLPLTIDLNEVEDELLDLTGLDQLGVGALILVAPDAGPMPTVIMPGVPQEYMHRLTIDGPGLLTLLDLTDLPPLLGTFECLGCGLTDIPTLDDWFRSLTMEDCDLSAGLDIPATITSLTLENCQLTACPALPPALQLCYLPYNAITALPPLPNTVTYLDVAHNPITELPELPASVHHLYLNNTLLATLPPLPGGIRYLKLDACALSVPLTGLPDGLEDLYASGLAIDPFPPQLPASLEKLGAHDLPITALPPLPASLTFLDVQNDTALQCLPVLPQGMTSARVAGSGITCLPNLPPDLFTLEWYLGIEALVCDPVASACPLVDPAATGHVFNDTNGNGVFDDGETGRAGTVVQATPGTGLTASGSDGRYLLPLEIGTYTVDGIPELYHVITTPPNVVELTGVGQLPATDIGYQAIPDMYDLVVQDVEQYAARPGFEAYVHAVVRNVGTETAAATITFELDADRSWVDATIAPTNLAGNTATWNVSLAPGEQWSVRVTAYTDVSVAAGMEITDIVTVAIAQADQTPANNTYAAQGVIVSSYDPNDKLVTPTSMSMQQLANEEELTYTVRFQNTGTASALRVVIVDTLSEHVRWDTFRFVSSSHACSWHALNGVVHFTFDPIDLPDSTTNGPASQGFVKFRIRPALDLLPGETVLNQAAIFFDLNAPVITPPAVFTVQTVLAMAEQAEGGLLLFPDPVTDMLSIACPGMAPNASIEVLDGSGRAVRTGLLRGPLAELDVQGLVQGIYALRVRDNGRLHVARFVKQ